MSDLTLAQLSRKAIPIAVDDALRAGYLALDVEFSGTFELHHVIPRDSVKVSSFIEQVYGIDQYAERFNSSENLIALPKDPVDAASLGLSQHKGNHPGYQDAIKQFHRDALAMYNSDKADLFEKYNNNVPFEEIDNLKAKYRSLHDRLEFKLKDGLVAHIAGKGDFHPTYAVYGKDVFLDPSEQGWDKLWDNVYQDLTLQNLQNNDPWFELDDFDKRLGSNIPEAFVASGTMIIDRESADLDDGKVQYVIGLDGATILTGKTDDVVIHFGSGEVRGGGRR